VVSIGACVSVAGCDNSWSAVVGHVLGFHWEQGQGKIFDTKCPREVKVGFEEGVKAKISAKALPIVCISDVVIIPVDDVDIPSHQSHLQHQDGVVCNVV
jgi:hypothetical protein